MRELLACGPKVRNGRVNSLQAGQRSRHAGVSVRCQRFMDKQLPVPMKSSGRVRAVLRQLGGCTEPVVLPHLPFCLIQQALRFGGFAKARHKARRAQ